jgi:hypothetical protein
MDSLVSSREDDGNGGGCGKIGPSLTTLGTSQVWIRNVASSGGGGWRCSGLREHDDLHKY